MQNYIKYLIVLFFVGTSVFAEAQTEADTLKREVEVTKAYTPIISDANKLNSMPEINEEETQKPTFNYRIKSQPFFSTFQSAPLKAATIETTPPEQRGYGLVRAGLGTYYKPYGELFFNNRNSKNTLFGLHAMHLSSWGDIKLESGNKVDAPYMDNQVELFVKHTINQSILSVDLSLDHNAFNYYGYPEDSIPAILLNDNQDINYFGTKQALTKGGIHIGLNNPVTDMDEETFDFDFDYHYLGTKTDQTEHFVNFTVDLRRAMNTGMGLLEAGIEYVRVDNITPLGDSVQGDASTTVLFAKPAWYVGSKKANVTLGLNTWFIMHSDDDAEAKLATNIRANWTPVEDILNLYAGVDGDFQHNYYSKIAYENPFVNPDHQLENSMQKYRFFGGFDGRFSKNATFKIDAEYAHIEDNPFYYLTKGLIPGSSSAMVVDNTFSVLYDNMDRFKLGAEFMYNSAKVNLHAGMNYYSYSLDEQVEAWNLPDWDATFSLTYNVNEQLSVTTDVFLLGNRQAMVYALAFDEQATDLYTLDTALDLNLRGNYQLTNKFSVFAQLNNFGFQKYERWLGYPVQSFNMLAGISYAF